MSRTVVGSGPVERALEKARLASRVKQVLAGYPVETVVDVLAGVLVEYNTPAADEVLVTMKPGVMERLAELRAKKEVSVTKSGNYKTDRSWYRAARKRITFGEVLEALRTRNCPTSVSILSRMIYGSDTRSNRVRLNFHLSTLRARGTARLVSRGVWVVVQEQQQPVEGGVVS